MDKHKVEYLKQNPRKEFKEWWNIPNFNPIVGYKYEQEINRWKHQTRKYHLESMQEYATSSRK